jgi:serine/threonine-protein kinase
MMPTRVRPDAPPAARRAAVTAQSSAPGDTIDDARFAPGHLLGGRYRIVGLLGRGGMGEVYRAEDLTLRQTVALKLLPEPVAGDSLTLERFRREVRIARQISHPNVCRVYDIGEADGLHFLSMEFIRGEELSSVVKRFGRLPADKAVEIARQICAGLAAAHRGGVLHRDLKPANVMIDEAGDARVTDFGLAGLVEEVRGDELAGTPLYMSPEQLSGKELTPRSDIYSLGLVLYELFTGKRAFDGATAQEVIRRRWVDATPTSPSSHVRDLDPVVERVILRCLELDPARRPASALEVAAALPGGDPLAAALAMGETPTPEMVAAAPTEGTLRPAVALAYLAGVLLGLALLVLLSERMMLYHVAPVEKSPEVLRERAREVLARLGYEGRAADSAEGFAHDEAYLRYVQEHDKSPARWESLRAGRVPVFQYWYRQGPRYLLPSGLAGVTPDDPAWTVSGSAGLRLDAGGRLRSFRAVTPQVEEGGGAAAREPDWSVPFAEARLDAAEFRATTPRWTPPDYADARAAWEGVWPDEPSIPVRVEAASFRGRPVYFEIVFPWDKPARQEGSQRPSTVINLLTGLLLVVTMLGGVLLARRNLRLGRGDRRGASRLALLIVVVNVLAYWVLTNHHVPQFRAELNLFLRVLSQALFWGGLVWVLYVALEPFVRARWPHRIISWNRLLAGDFRDPLVGRDILVGSLFGVGYYVVYCLWWLTPGWLGRAPSAPAAPPEQLGGLMGLRGYLSAYLAAFWNDAVVFPLAFLFLLLLLFIVLRRQWLSTLVGWAMLTLVASLTGSHPAVDLFFCGVLTALCIFSITRLGLLATSAFFTLNAFTFLPLTWDFSAWYAPYAALTPLLLAAPALYGCYTSLAGQPLLRGDLLRD